MRNTRMTSGNELVLRWRTVAANDGGVAGLLPYVLGLVCRPAGSTAGREKLVA